MRNDPIGKFFLLHSKQYLSELAEFSSINQDFDILVAMQKILDNAPNNIQMILEVDVNQIKTIIEEGMGVSYG